VDEEAPLLPAYDVLPLRAVQGPQQLRLEHAPCRRCLQAIAVEAASLVCDLCNNCYHLRCTSRTTVPDTYWYCQDCTRHLHARGIQEPAEDIAFQQYLHTTVAPPTLLAPYATLARVYKWQANVLMHHHQGVWKQYPSAGQRVLLLEEVHTTYLHICAPKMFHMLSTHY
jgi:hypothetical protein